MKKSGSRSFSLKCHLLAFAASALAASLSIPEPLAAEESHRQPEKNMGVAVDEEISDPLEGFNRGIFWFNDKLDVYFFEPVARGYHWVLPQVVEDGVGNIFNNILIPQHLLNDALQLKGTQAAKHLGRFLINTTIGLGGFFDVAKEMGMERHNEDFGTTLGYYGLNGGPYLVLPLLGPSNARDAVGQVVDGLVDPVYMTTNYTNAFNSDDAFWINLGYRAAFIIDTRSGLLEAVDTGKGAALDYYLFMQSAYYQFRRGQIYDGKIPGDDNWDEE
jgi:phospholipid-binding lipoprotein MlaA